MKKKAKKNIFEPIFKLIGNAFWENRQANLEIELSWKLFYKKRQKNLSFEWRKGKRFEQKKLTKVYVKIDSFFLSVRIDFYHISCQRALFILSRYNGSNCADNVMLYSNNFIDNTVMHKQYAHLNMYRRWIVYSKASWIEIVFEI